MADLKYEALVDEDQIVRGLLYLTQHGCYYRDQGDWISMHPDDDMPFDLLELESVATGDLSVTLWDSAERTEGTVVLSDVA